MKPVLFVSHEASVSPGIASEVFAEAGMPCRVMRAWEEAQWPKLDEIAGLVVLGGDMSATEIEAFPFLRGVRAFVGVAVEQGVPTLGICLGAQILAMVLGGTVRRSPRVEVGFETLEATEEGRRDRVLGGFATPGVAVFQWHEDTFDLPAAATLLMSGGGFQQAFRFGPNVYGTQFHFEVTEQDVAAWIASTPPERLRERWGWSPQDLLEVARCKLPAQQEIGREAFRRFSELMEA